jgi:ELWxxDGT repeat protein
MGPRASLRTVAVALTAVLLSCASSLPAQLATLLKDIQPTIDSYGSNPKFVGSFAGTAFFTAFVPTLGVELYATDGTPEGTRMFLDACPGDCSTYWHLLGEAGGHLFLAGGAHEHSTSEILAIEPGPRISLRLRGGTELTFGSLVESHGYSLIGEGLYFSASRGTLEPALFRTGGTSDPPEVVAELPLGDPAYGFVAAGTSLFFWRHDGLGNSELWRSDGSTAGTSRVTSFTGYPVRPGVAIGGHDLLFAFGDAEGPELWSSDGTGQGTRRLTFFPDNQAEVGELVSDGAIGFAFVTDASFGQDLYRSDGTPEGTFALTAFGYHAPFGDDYDRSPLVLAGHRAYFNATDAIGETALWSSGADAGSAHREIDLCAGSCTGGWIQGAGGDVFFVREDPATGAEVWRVEDAGVRLFHDACPGSCSGGGIPIAADSSRFAYITGSGGNNARLLLASAPWGAPSLLYDPARDAPRLSGSPYDPHDGIFAGERLFFPARDLLGSFEPWTSLGTLPSTLQLADLVGPQESTSQLSEMTIAGETAAFTAWEDSLGRRLWLTDGSREGTRRIERAEPPCARVEPANERFVEFGCGETILGVDPATDTTATLATVGPHSLAGSGSTGGFAAAILATGSALEVWRSDGTAAGTAFAFSLASDWYVDSKFLPVNGKLLLRAGPSFRLHALSSSGLALVPIGPTDYYPDIDPAPLGTSLAYFSSDSVVWRTDGTPAGTFPLDLPPGYRRLQGAVPNGGGFDLLVLNDAFEDEVWTTTGGTTATLRATISGALNFSNGTPMSRVGDELYVACAIPIGLSVLRDGESTAHPLQPEGVSGFYVSPVGFSSADGRLLFAGCDDAHGCELWTSDGTDAGTRLFQDILPGAASSSPGSFAETPSRFYFVADDGLHSFEPWTLPRDVETPCVASGQALCLEGGRFLATASWIDFEGHAGDAEAVALSPDTGYFWFFDESNVETILKVLDGGGTNGHHWAFYGALTNLQYALTITDSATGAARRYFNPAARFASAGDIYAFGPQGAHALGGTALVETAAASPPHVATLAGIPSGARAGSCTPDADRFCILGGRFAVEATWRDFYGNSGAAQASTLTDDTGYLWFFDEANVEVVLKAVDGGGYNGHFWIYFGALSNVEYTITVTDTATGDARVYTNALGNFASFGDIEAFPAP